MREPRRSSPQTVGIENGAQRQICFSTPNPNANQQSQRRIGIGQRQVGSGQRRFSIANADLARNGFQRRFGIQMGRLNAECASPTPNIWAHHFGIDDPDLALGWWALRHAEFAWGQPNVTWEYVIKTTVFQ